jgi:Fungal specific transcription factor domain
METPEAELLDQLERNSTDIFLHSLPLQTWEHDSQDSLYMDYFRRRVKLVLPYFEVFPLMTDEIMCRATYDRGLQHTVLSVSHLIADARLHRSLVPAFQHQTQALSLLQKALSTTDITEALTISVAMLAWLNMARSNRPTLNQHLEGLYLIFQELFSRNRPFSSLMKQVWRFSLRLDLLATVLFFPRVPLFPPVGPDEERFNREWVRESTSADLTEWTLASFALDNLMHRASHLAMEVYESRSQKEPGQVPSTQIEEWIQLLLEEHNAWLLRPIVQQGMVGERLLNAVKVEDEATTSSFLDYPPLQIQDNFYANMMNSWRAIYIFIDLIAKPQVGPVDGTSSKRYEYAVDICRTYAALPRDELFPLGKIISVFFAGVAFGGSRLSPEHVKWLDDTMLIFLQEHLPLNAAAVVVSFPS